MAFSGCCLVNCQPKCTHDCTNGDAPGAIAFVMAKPSNYIGVPANILNSSDGVVANFTAQVSAASTANLTADEIQSFNFSGFTAHVTVQGGNLFGSSGIATIKVLDSTNRIVASHRISYAIYGNTIALQNPAKLSNWISSNAQTLLNKGAKGVAISANLPILAAHNTSNVVVKTSISFSGITFAMARRSYIPGVAPQKPTLPGVITVAR